MIPYSKSLHVLLIVCGYMEQVLKPESDVRISVTILKAAYIHLPTENNLGAICPFSSRVPKEIKNAEDAT